MNPIQIILRDKFAQAALTGLLAQMWEHGPLYHCMDDADRKLVAERAYRIADAMMAARSAGTAGTAIAEWDNPKPDTH